MSALKDVRDSIPRLAEEYRHHTREARVAALALEQHRDAAAEREPLLRALGVDVDALAADALRGVLASWRAEAPTVPAPADDDDVQPGLPLDAALPPPPAVPAGVEPEGEGDAAEAAEASDARMARALDRVVSWMEGQGLAFVERDTPTLCLAAGITDVSPRGLSRRLAAIVRGRLAHPGLEVVRLDQAEPLKHLPQVWRLTRATAPAEAR